MAWRRRKRPVPVILNRFLAPLWVFIFGGLVVALLTGSVSFLLAFPFPVRHTHLGLERSHEHDHGPALHPWRLLDRAVRTELISELIEQGFTQIRVGHLAAAEAHRHLDLVALLEELEDLLHLRVIVVVVDVRTHLDLLDLLRLLRLACEVRLLLRLVLELADIEELGDGRIGVGRDLNQVQTMLGRLLDRFARVHHAQILALVIDHADLLALDEFVESRAVHRGRLHGPAHRGRTYGGCSCCF